MFRKLIEKAYSKRLLVLTNTITGVVSMSIGDILQQNIEKTKLFQDKDGLKQNLKNITNENKETLKKICDKKHDEQTWNPIRTRNMAFAGVYFSLFGHYWFSFLDRKFPPKSSGAVMKKVFAEIFMGPILVSNCFFLIGYLKGSSLNKCWEYLKSNWLLIVGVEWAVYIPLQWLNFALVPSQYRYLFVATISLAYDVFLSFILHRNERKEAEE